MTSGSLSKTSSSSDGPDKKSGPVKSQSVPPLTLHTTCGIEYENLGKKPTSSAPMSASSSRSESPLSDRYCGKCSSLISLHLRTIESDWELTRTASTQTRPQSKGKLNSRQKLKPARKSPKCSLEKMEIVTAAAPLTASTEVSPSRKLKRSHPLRSASFLPLSRTAFETSSSNESLHSST